MSSLITLPDELYWLVLEWCERVDLRNVLIAHHVPANFVLPPSLPTIARLHTLFTRGARRILRKPRAEQYANLYFQSTEWLGLDYLLGLCDASLNSGKAHRTLIVRGPAIENWSTLMRYDLTDARLTLTRLCRLDLVFAPETRAPRLEIHAPQLRWIYVVHAHLCLTAVATCVDRLYLRDASLDARVTLRVEHLDTGATRICGNVSAECRILSNQSTFDDGLITPQLRIESSIYDFARMLSRLEKTNAIWRALPEIRRLSCSNGFPTSGWMPHDPYSILSHLPNCTVIDEDIRYVRIDQQWVPQCISHVVTTAR